MAVLDDIIKDSLYSKDEYFRDIRRGFEEIIKLIEDYAAKFTEGFGVLPSYKKGGRAKKGKKGVHFEEPEHHEEHPEHSEHEEHMSEDVDVSEGGAFLDAIKRVGQLTKKAIEKAPSAIEKGEKVVTQGLSSFGNIAQSFGQARAQIKAAKGGGLSIPEITRMSYQLNRLKQVILYYFRTARIRVNLAKASQEMKAYSEDYTKILADAIANSVDECKRKFNKIQADCQEDGIMYKTVVKSSAGSAANSLEKERIQKYLEAQAAAHGARINMYHIVEAVDLYMQAFANAVAAHPDDLKDILKILNSTEVISKWFTERSGDMLCQVFDCFPASYVGDDPKFNNLNESYGKGDFDKQHYYARVAMICHLGDPRRLFDGKHTKFDPSTHADYWTEWEKDGKSKGCFPNVPIDGSKNDRSGPSLPGVPFLGLDLWSDKPEDCHTGEKAIKCAEKALSIGVLKNIISIFVTVGEHFGGQNLFKSTHMSPALIYKGLLNYMAQSAFAIGISKDIQPTVDVVRHPLKGLPKKGGVGPDDEPTVHFVDVGSPILPPTFSPPVSGPVVTPPPEGLLEEIVDIPEEVVEVASDDVMRALAELEAMPPFASGPVASDKKKKFGLSRFALVPGDKVTLTHVQDVWSPDSADVKISYDVPPGVMGLDHTFGKNRVRTGITANASVGSNVELKRRFSVAMRGVDKFSGLMPWASESDISVSGSPFSQEYDETDLLFTLVIKSVVAKVLTAVGVYNMFNRPINQDGLGYFSGLRMILGGAIETPKIVGEALELYIRLPLLAEFYRCVFNFEDRDTAFRAISMVPEMDGTFSGLISIIFDRARYVKDGSYSETDIRSIIEEINKIWLRFRDHKNLVTDVIHEFIAEVNRRIGIYERQERDRFLKERDERYKNRYTDQEDLTDFELSSIDENDTHWRPSPSMSYETEGTGLAGKFRHKHKLDPHTHMFYINQVRETVDKMFTKAQGRLGVTGLDGLSGGLSFDSMIRARREELRHSRDEKERFDIIRSAIASLGQFAMPALERSMILFHETVIAPLSTMYVMYKMLRDFHDGLNHVYSAIAEVRKWTLNLAADSELITNNRVMGGNDKVEDFLYGDGTAISVIAQGGRQGVLPNERLTYANLDAALSALQGSDKKRMSEILYRFIPNQAKIFFRVMEMLYGHASCLDSLVELHIDVVQGKENPACAIVVQLDHSKLRQYISDAFNSIKQSINKFRGLLPGKILDAYEKHDAEGSLYWLEKRLIDELLEGKWEDPEGQSVRNDNLDHANTKLKFIFDYLTTPWKSNGRGLGSGILGDYETLKELTPKGTYGVKSDIGSRQEFDRELYDLIFYNPFQNSMSADFQEGWEAIDSYNQEKHTGLLKLLFNTSGRVKDGMDKGLPWDSKMGFVSDQLYDPMHGFMFDDSHHSLFVTFNRLVAAYLTQVYDGAMSKVYITTINEFANGAFSTAVFGKSYYEDVDILATNNIVEESTSDRYYGTTGVLVKSLAQMLKQLLTEKTINGDKKQYLESDLAEIPLYMKEQMKASLPIFEKMFCYLNQRCELIKNMVRALNVAQPVNNQQLFDGNGKCTKKRWMRDGTEEDPDQWLEARSDVDNKRNLIKIVDQIMSGCTALLQCIRNTLGELADDPKYFELYQGFISEYEGANGRQPFMPQSSMSIGLRNNSKKMWLPIHKLGDAEFKLQYGTRGVLCHRDVKASDMPGMLQLIKEHNQSAEVKHHFDEKAADKLLEPHLTLLRYLIDARNYRGIFSEVKKVSHGSEGAGVLTGENEIARGPISAYSHVTMEPFDAATKDSVPFSLRPGTELSDVIRMTESAYQKEQRRKIVVLVEADDICNMGDREDMIIYNIIDLNVVPINVHALRREIPLVNLYNYSWTFDKLISDIFDVHEHKSDARLGMSELSRREPGRCLLGHLLLDPYKGIENEVYETVLPQITRGDLGIEGLGRPKYLADEIYGKALFGEMYPGTLYYDEGGPASGQGHLNTLVGLMGDAEKGINKRPEPNSIKDIPSQLYRKDRRAASTANQRYSPNSLHYLSEDDQGQTQICNVDVKDYKDILQGIGKMRFDTVLVRNIFWLVNIQRALRLKLRRDLTWFDQRVVSDHAVTASGITELFGNDMQSRNFPDTYKY